MIGRRQLLIDLISLVAAPAIVRASSLMPVKSFVGDSVALIHVNYPEGALLIDDVIRCAVRGFDAYGVLKTEWIELRPPHQLYRSLSLRPWKETWCTQKTA